MKLPKLPDARTVRDVMGQVEVGHALVSYKSTTAGRDLFPWVVYGPKIGPDAEREEVDTCAIYREAVTLARRVSKQHDVAVAQVDDLLSLIDRVRVSCSVYTNIVSLVFEEKGVLTKEEREQVLDGLIDAKDVLQQAIEMLETDGE